MEKSPMYKKGFDDAISKLKKSSKDKDYIMGYKEGTRVRQYARGEPTLLDKLYTWAIIINVILVTLIFLVSMFKLEQSLN
jgi:hypothetical protein